MISCDEIYSYVDSLPEPLGFSIENNQICKFKSNQTEGTFYILNLPFLLTSQNFAIVGRGIFAQRQKLLYGELSMDRGDKLEIRIEGNNNQFYLNDIFLYELPAQEYIIRGHVIHVADNSNILQDILTCVNTRTYNYDCIKIWQKIDQQEVSILLNYSTELCYRFTLLQCLTMSPLPYTEKLLVCAFQTTGSKDMEQYHIHQVNLAFYYFNSLTDVEIKLLVDYLVTLSERTQFVQSGVCAQVWRGLIRYCRVNNNENLESIILILLEKFVIPEADGRQEIYKSENKFLRLLFAHYINQYVRAYDTKDFEIDIQFLVQKFPQILPQVLILGANTFFNQNFFKQLLQNGTLSVDLLTDGCLHKLTKFFPLLGMLHAGISDITDQIQSIEIIPKSLLYYCILINNYKTRPKKELLDQVFNESSTCNLSLLFSLQHYNLLDTAQQKAIIFRTINGQLTNLQYEFQFLLKYEKLLPQESIDIQSILYFDSQYDKLQLLSPPVSYKEIISEQIKLAQEQLETLLPNQETSNKLKDQQQILEDELDNLAIDPCPICFGNNPLVQFGCGHGTCHDCFRKVEQCPICRSQFKQIVWDNEVLEDLWEGESGE